MRSPINPQARTPERRAAQRSAANAEQIVDRVLAAVMEHRLPAGTKLAEGALCDALGTSRSVVRRALLVLAERGIVDLRSNRGAFIASPSPEMARNVFEARRTIEVAVVGNAVDRLKPAQLAALRSLTEREAAMRRAENRHEAIRLSGEFHVRLAEFAGNPVLLRFVEELVAQTSLIIGLFGSLRLPSCSDEEHRGVIDAIEARKEAAAATLMVQHLDHIESELDLAASADPAVDLGAILGSALASRRGQRQRA